MALPVPPHDEFITTRRRSGVADVNTRAGHAGLMTANRNGLYYVLDRTNGQFLTGSPTQK
jgi:glucose dehydrogenase